MRQSRTHRVLPLAGLLAWILLPLVVIAGLSGVSRSLSLDDEDVEVWVPVATADQSLARGVDVVLRWDTTVDIVAPAWSGVVQRISIGGGTPLSNGQEVALINGVRRIAAHTPIPFHRQISSSLRGDDVRALNDLLERLGYPHATDDTATWQTTRGIRELAAGLGAGSSIDSFDPAWIIYLPYEGYVVEAVQLAVGSPAPASGQTILTGTPRIAAAELVIRDSVAVPPSNPAGTASPPPRVQLRDEVRLVADPAEFLQIAGVMYELGDTRSNIAETSLSAVAALLAPHQVLVRAQLVRPTREGDVEVPSAGIITDAAGTQCLRVDPDNPRWVAVDILASREGLAVVAGSLSIGEKVHVGATMEPEQCS